MERKTGARGLRTILEDVLLDTMFDLPSLKNARRVVLDRGAIMGQNKPLVVYETDEPLALKPPEEYERATGSDG